MLAKGPQMLPPELKTVRQRIYWAYANLARAETAVDLNQRNYGKRARLALHATFNGLSNGSRTLRPSVKDERIRPINSGAVSYDPATRDPA